MTNVGHFRAAGNLRAYIHTYIHTHSMTNIGHFRAAGKLLDKFKGQIPSKLWLAPPTKMDAAQVR